MRPAGGLSRTGVPKTLRLTGGGTGRTSVLYAGRARPDPLHFLEKVRPSLYPTALVIEIGKLDDSSLGMSTRERLHDGGRHVAIATAEASFPRPV